MPQLVRNQPIHTFNGAIFSCSRQGSNVDVQGIVFAHGSLRSVVDCVEEDELDLDSIELHVLLSPGNSIRVRKALEVSEVRVGDPKLLQARIPICMKLQTLLTDGYEV